MNYISGNLMYYRIEIPTEDGNWEEYFQHEDEEAIHEMIDRKTEKDRKWSYRVIRITEHEVEVKF